MSDIVERLKYCAEHGLIDAASNEMAAGYGEAAAEIEKLWAELQDAKREIELLIGLLREAHVKMVEDDLWINLRLRICDAIVESDGW